MRGLRSRLRSALRRLTPKNGGDFLPELLEAERLLNEGGDPFVGKPVFDLLFIISARENDTDIRADLPHPAECLSPIHARHRQVQENAPDVLHVATKELECLLAVRGQQA